MSGQNRIRSLDGIRGTFIIMVLIAHVFETTPEFKASYRELVYYISGFGHLGVRIFFVMSGYLITRLLIREQEKTGKVSLKDFYIRRMFRIFPTFFLYIFVILLLKWTLIPDIFSNYSLILFASFYLWNYKHLFIGNLDGIDKGTWFMGHFWSLSMEEQFYLLWPVTFVKLSTRTLIRAVLILISVMPLLRVATFLFLPGSRPHVSEMLHTGGDAILTGCLAALLEQLPGFREKYFRYVEDKKLIATVACFLFIVSPLLTWYGQAAYNLTIGITLNNFSIMFLLYWAMYVPSGPADFFNTPVISRLGIASYSLYVWQQLFLTDKNDLWVNKFPQNLFVAIGIGLASHYLVEKPILRLKDRFKRV